MAVRRSINVLLYGALLATVVVAAATLARSDGNSDTPVSDASEASVDTANSKVLYLRRETALTAPGVDLPRGDHFYMPLGLANGLLRVDGTEVVATGQFPVAALDVDAQAIIEERGRDEAAGRAVEPILARMPLSVVG